MQNHQAIIDDLNKYTVAIQEAKEDGGIGRILGTGVIVTDDGLIFTCYHVVKSKKNDKILDQKNFNVYFTNTKDVKRAEIVEDYSNASLDIAFLQLQEKLPEQTKVAPLSGSVYFGHEFASIGFRKPDAFDSLTSKGEIRRITTTAKQKASMEDLTKPMLQLYSDEIEGGMSGAPVLDLEINRVIGIISEHWFSASKVDTRLNFAIPVESIVKIYSELKQKNPGLRPIFNFVSKIGEQGTRKYERIDELYVPPINYQDIKKSLEEDKILFLTGTQEYGKTYTAVYLLWEFYNKGYEPVWFKGSEEKEERRDVRRKFTNVEKSFKSNSIIYFEDPFGKTEYEVNVDEGIVRNIATIIETVENTEDTYVIITSREEVFKEFRRKITAEVDLRKYEKKLGVKTLSYDYEKRKEMLLKYAAFMNCKWVEDKELTNIVLETIKDKIKLPTPLNIAQFALSSAIIKNVSLEKDKLLEKINAKSKETAKSFAQEIETMSTDRMLFLSFPFISEYFSVDFIKENYEKLVKEIDTEKLNFYTMVEWFKDDKIDISYVDWIKNNAIRFSHPSYYEAFEFAIDENSSSSKLRKVLCNVLLNIAHQREAVYFVATAVAKNYNNLGDDNVRNLLFTLADGENMAPDVAAAVDSNFDKLPINVRNQLLLKLADREYVAQRVAETIAKNYNNLGDDNVRNLLFTLADRDEDAARDVAYAISYKFDKLPESVRNNLLLKLISHNKALRSIAYDVFAFWDKIPNDIRHSLVSELLKHEPGTFVQTIFSPLKRFRNDEQKYNFARDLLFYLADNKDAAVWVATVLTSPITFNELSDDNLRDQLLLKLAYNKDAAESIAFDMTHDLDHRFDNLSQNIRSELLNRLAKYGYNID